MRRIAMLVYILSLAGIVSNGCGVSYSDPDLLMAGNHGRGQATYLDKAAIRNESGVETASAMEAAMEWSNRYHQVSSDRDLLQRENRELAQENQKIKTELDQLKFNLTRAEKELSEANDMMMEMTQALEKWKTDVLGFRKEMQMAQKVQLEALIKILKLIGGDVDKELVTIDIMENQTAKVAAENQNAPIE